MRRVAPELQQALERLGAAVAVSDERQARKEAGIIQRARRGCSIRRQQDEHVCSTCGGRWDVSDSVDCPRDLESRDSR